MHDLNIFFVAKKKAGPGSVHIILCCFRYQEFSEIRKLLWDLLADYIFRSPFEKGENGTSIRPYITRLSRSVIYVKIYFQMILFSIVLGPYNKFSRFFSNVFGNEIESQSALKTSLLPLRHRQQDGTPHFLDATSITEVLNSSKNLGLDERIFFFNITWHKCNLF